MLKTRVIPCLLLKGQALVKTIKFKNYNYIGDAINTVRIFNQLEVDELIFLDITATNENRQPDPEFIKDIASECFMPVCYGGGINNSDTAKMILKAGVEKISINSSAFSNQWLIKNLAEEVGSQSVIVSIDVKKNFLGKYEVITHSGKFKTGKDPVTYAKIMEDLGAGEILLNSIDRDGTWEGYDLNLIKQVTSSVSIPVIACGGAGSIDDFTKAVKSTSVSAVAAGSLFVYQKKNLGVLINYPSHKELETALN